MRRRHHATFLLLIIVTGMALAACARSSVGATPEKDEVSVDHIDGTNVARITLSSHVAQRLGIATQAVREPTGTSRGKASVIIPYAAVLYDPEGHTWTYTSPRSLVFVRTPIRVSRIKGNVAVLASGPRRGTKVVTVGAAELLGIEYEVGEE